MKILFAVDGSPSTMKAAEFLASRPEIMGGAEVVLLNVQPEMSPRVKGFVSADKLRQAQAEDFDEAVAEAAAFLDSKGVKFAKAMASGEAGQAIAKEAQARGCEMIVMGTRGHGMVGRLVMGSVAQSVVSESQVPVLLVK